MKYLAPDYRLPQAAGSTALSAQAGLLHHSSDRPTPEGRFEVYALGNRGLDRTARYAPSRYAAGYDYPADLAYDAIDEAAQADETGPPVDDRFAVAVEPVALPGPAAADLEPPAPPVVGRRPPRHRSRHGPAAARSTARLSWPRDPERRATGIYPAALKASGSCSSFRPTSR